MALYSTIPDYTPASPDYSPASDSESDPSEDPSSDHIPPLPAISPFLSSDDDPTDSDTPDTHHHLPIYRVRLSLRLYASTEITYIPLVGIRSLEASQISIRMLHCVITSPVSEALSPVRADLIPSPKRVKDSGYLADVEVDPREISLRDDAIVRCFAYCSALRDRGIEARVVVEVVDRDETKTGMRGPVEVRVKRVTHPAMPEDILAALGGSRWKATYETLGDFVQSIGSSAFCDDRSVRNLMGNFIAKFQQRTLEPLNENGDEQEGENRGNGNGGIEKTEMEIEMGILETEGVCRIDRWFEKMETVFNISNCPSKYQVKYATCTLQDSALTWFQELILLCTKMVPDEEDKVERFIGGLSDNIQGNVIAANPARVRAPDAYIALLNQLME
ncbi:hypothetical protein Tco_0237486 [Tanacetum coccineum]